MFHYNNLHTIRELPTRNPRIDPKFWICEFPQGNPRVICDFPYCNLHISLKFVKNKNPTNFGAVGVGLETPLTPLTILSSQPFLLMNYKKRIGDRGEGDQYGGKVMLENFPWGEKQEGLDIGFQRRLIKQRICNVSINSINIECLFLPSMCNACFNCFRVLI